MAILAAIFLSGIVLWLIGNAMESKKYQQDARENREWDEEVARRKAWLASIDYPGKPKPKA
jgi:hypothetical protein